MKSDWFREIDVGESEQIISLNFEWTHSLLAKPVSDLPSHNKFAFDSNKREIT